MVSTQKTAPDLTEVTPQTTSAPVGVLNKIANSGYVNERSLTIAALLVAPFIPHVGILIGGAAIANIVRNIGQNLGAEGVREVASVAKQIKAISPKNS